MKMRRWCFSLETWTGSFQAVAGGGQAGREVAVEAVETVKAML
jgi:hypothetical protein